MKVNELIEVLKHFDKNMEVCIGVYSQPSTIAEIETSEVYKYKTSYTYDEDCMHHNKKEVVLITPFDTE